MLGCPPDSKAVPAAHLTEVKRASPSAVEEQVVQLFDEVRVPLLRYLSAFQLSMSDSEDVVQEVFLSLFQQFQRGKAPQNPRGWVFRAAHNLALKRRMRFRKDPENTRSFTELEALMIDPGLNPEDQVASHQTQRRLRAVVRALPEPHRWCLYLRAEGLRYREIAEMLGMSLGAVSLSLERSLTLIARATQR